MTTQPEKVIGTGPVGKGDYVVQENDCISSIAYEAGFFPETLWDLPENAELKMARKHLNVLLPGDKVFIPKVRTRIATCETGKVHVFKLKGVPEKLRLRFLEDGEPRDNLDYTLTVGDKKFKGKTDENGSLEHWIPPDAIEATLTGPELGAYDLNLGGMDPEDSESGARSRLVNLGYLENRKDTEVNAEEYVDALKTFQTENNLKVTGKLDEATKAKLLENYGG